jgi:hypothetical protein
MDENGQKTIDDCKKAPEYPLIQFVLQDRKLRFPLDPEQFPVHVERLESRVSAKGAAGIIGGTLSRETII